jgi:hypothetical protein
MVWNSQPAYPTPLVLLVSAFALLVLFFGFVGLADWARTWRKPR